MHYLDADSPHCGYSFLPSNFAFSPFLCNDIEKIRQFESNAPVRIGIEA